MATARPLAKLTVQDRRVRSLQRELRRERQKHRETKMELTKMHALLIAERIKWL